MLIVCFHDFFMKTQPRKIIDNTQVKYNHVVRINAATATLIIRKNRVAQTIG